MYFTIVFLYAKCFYYEFLCVKRKVFKLDFTNVLESTGLDVVGPDTVFTTYLG